MSVSSDVSWQGKFVAAMQNGAKIMALQAVPVNALNRVSVVCCHNDLSMARAAQNILAGKIDGKAPSLIHFTKGMIGHVGKESLRLSFKAGGLVILKPQLEEHYREKCDRYGSLKASFLFSLTLAGGEIVINPADTWKTMLHSGKGVRSGLLPGQSVFLHLYSGAAANGMRQFGTWMVFSTSESVCNSAMDKTTSIDPHSLTGIVVKSYPQSVLLTSVVYIFERVKNELQYHPALKEEAKRKKISPYRVAIEHIYDTQKARGFLRGMAAKTWSNAILVLGSNYLLEKGRAVNRKK